MDALVAEGLDYLEKSGDAGDVKYVAAIRASLADAEAELDRLRAFVREVNEAPKVAYVRGTVPCAQAILVWSKITDVPPQGTELIARPARMEV